MNRADELEALIQRARKAEKLVRDQASLEAYLAEADKVRNFIIEHGLVDPDDLEAVIEPRSTAPLRRTCPSTSMLKSSCGECGGRSPTWPAAYGSWRSRAMAKRLTAKAVEKTPTEGRSL